MSASIKILAGMQVGVVIWCHGEGCTRLTTYVPAGEILAKFGDVTCEQAQRKVRCTTCGTHGRDGKVDILPSTLDIGDLNHGRPSGTSERQQVERRVEHEAIFAAEKARYGRG
jgi:hypothetical protein